MLSPSGRILFAPPSVSAQNGQRKVCVTVSAIISIGVLTVSSILSSTLRNTRCDSSIPHVTISLNLSEGLCEVEAVDSDRLVIHQAKPGE